MLPICYICYSVIHCTALKFGSIFISALSIDEQLAKDIQLVDSIAERQAQIFSEECKLFPADVQIQSIYPL